MRQKSERHRDTADRAVKDIHRKTRRRYSLEDKIRIVLAGLRGEDSIAELCRRRITAESRSVKKLLTLSHGLLLRRANDRQFFLTHKIQYGLSYLAGGFQWVLNSCAKEGAISPKNSPATITARKSFLSGF
jgi:transposase